MENINQNQGGEGKAGGEEGGKDCCGWHKWGKWCKGRGAKCGGGLPACRQAGGGCVYGLGLIGAAIYYIQSASGFWPIVLGILKAIVWPAMVVYKLLGFLGA